MDFLPNQCAAQSLGPANQLVTMLIQSLLSSYCSILETGFWPSDYGLIASQMGKRHILC